MLIFTLTIPLDPQNPDFSNVCFSGSNKIYLDSESSILVIYWSQEFNTFSLSIGRENDMYEIFSSPWGSSTSFIETAPNLSY